MDLPARIADVDALEELMSRPSPELAARLAQAPGDIMVLGVGGKMGPTLARMAKRADPERRVIGVARFSEPGLREQPAGAAASNASRPTCCRARRWRACRTRPTSSSWPAASSAPPAANG